MLGLAYRQLIADRGRSALTALGIAAVLAVILILQGFQQGIYAQLRNVALERGADLIAAQAGVSNLVAARSVIPQMTRAEVEAVEGVRAAHPMTALPMIYEKAGQTSAVFLTVVDELGGPPVVKEGTASPGEREVVVDRSLARLFDLKLGDDFVLAGYAFRIAGISEGAVAMFTPFAFVGFGSLVDFYFEANLADDISAFPLLSYLLIQLDEGADRSAVARAIEAQVPAVDVWLPQALADNDERLGRTIFGAVLAVLLSVAYLAGLLVVALFMFATADARRRDLGVLKAVGFESRSLVGSIVLETLMLIVLALPLGVATALAFSRVVQVAMPTYLLLPTVPAPLVLSLALVIAFALLGALLPLRFVRHLDPAEAFRS